MTEQVTDEHGRPEPPLRADEEATLVGFLEWQRATFAWKCAGVDTAGLAATVGVSSMTLGGMVKHLALVEDYWFGERLLGRDPGPPWDGVDWDADRDWEWHSAAHDAPEELQALWQESVERSRAALREVLAVGGLDGVVRRPQAGQGPASVRWVLCHMIEEYARHNGHADLLRESIDGQTGE
ncbi:MAG: DinB family protein [Actinomycetota bacterium]|nr:DinB family protein [Actinomycetota bacterium]